MKSTVISFLFTCLCLAGLSSYAGNDPHTHTDSLQYKEFDEAFILEEAKRLGLNPLEAQYYVQNIKASYEHREYNPDLFAPTFSGPITPPLPNCMPGFETGVFNPWTASNFVNMFNSGTIGKSITNSIQTRGRQSIMADKTINDPIGGFPVVAPRWSKDPGGENEYSLKLGNRFVGAEGESATIEYETTDNFVIYSYALVLQDPSAIAGAPSHDPTEKPFFEVKLYIDDVLRVCGSFKVIAGSGLIGFYYTQGGAYVYKPWTQNVIDCSQYGYVPSQNRKIKLEFTTADCLLGGHFGYAYIDLSCLQPQIKRTGRSCINAVNTYTSSLFGNYKTERIRWEFFDWDEGATTWAAPKYVLGELVSSGTKSQTITSGDIPNYASTDIEKPQYAFTTKGNKKIRLTVSQLKVDGTPLCDIILELYVTIDDCIGTIVQCKECISSFAPIPGNKYLVSAWVREETVKPIKYTEPGIYMKLNGPGTALGPFLPTGKIIDGWQKIEQEFLVPDGTYSIEVTLKNTNAASSQAVYFDDIRIMPFKGSMKSYVYDPYTQKLVAELDENNYATFYEYDEEGSLVRVKKETERGIMTIKENGSNKQQFE
jgi:hypothetical protein